MKQDARPLSKAEHPLVSIIVRTKDRPKLLRNALQSLARQTYRPIEVVLVNDGGCALDTGEIKSILGDISFNYQWLGKNTGRAHAGNVGIESAKGEYIGFLDDDDEFYPEHALTLVSLMEQLDYKVAYSDSQVVYKAYDPESQEFLVTSKEVLFSRDFDYDFLVFENYIPFMCLLFRKEILIEVGGIDEDLDLYEDWDMLIRLGEKHPFFHVREVTACYNQWSSDMQIALQNKDQFFIKKSYMRIIEKNCARIGPNRIHKYVSDYTNARFELKKVRNDLEPRAQQDYFRFLFGMNTARGNDYVPLSFPDIPESDIRLLAFYLPQFHPIPENDEWWGKGFTEWMNVTRAVPQFIGHFQPRLPGELGFYDLRMPEVQQRQVELAKRYGIRGFCFHFYWFDGRTLLETPLQNFSENLDFPFCINWANENWTRRWDGEENEILISQKHSPEDDIKFIRYVSRYLKNKNYIRIKSRPLLIVYRPALFPDPKATAARWRTWCHENDIGDIYLAATHSFEHVDPRDIGFDAAIEFPPNTFPLKDISGGIGVVNRNFKGIVYDYRDAVEWSKKCIKPPYKKFRGIFPMWDNEARKPGRGTAVIHSDPGAYKEWLKFLCNFTAKNFDAEERLVFLNAWNEWAEGAYIEPDRRYGYAYLQATAEALSVFPAGSASLPGQWKILFVSHDACRGGAQTALLSIISWFKRHTFADIRILCLDGGELLPRFSALGDTRVLNDMRNKRISEDELVGNLRDFCGGVPDLIYGNSVASGREYSLLRKLGAPIIMHFHEMEMSIRRYAADYIDDVIAHSAHFIAISGAVRRNLVANHGVDNTKISLVYSSITPDSSMEIGDSRKQAIRSNLGLEKDKVLVFGCGLGMAFRKGADLFIEAARTLLNRGFDNFHFYWVGDFDGKERDDRYGVWAECVSALGKEGLDKYVTFLGLKDNPKEYMQAGDIFLLTSREEPVGLVGLEAAECGLPVICFADAGGMPDFVGDDAGYVVAYADVGAMVDKIALLVSDENLRRQLGVRGRGKVLSRVTVEHTTPHVLSACRRAAQKKPAVSVIIPNYNHELYLGKRLDSVFGQTFRDFEVILLDDASTDNSMEMFDRYADHADVRILRNEKNSGSPFRQWIKGIDLANAEIIWIAESDDLCEPGFLETLLPAFRDPGVKLAYASSHVIDENDKVTGDYENGEYLTSLSKTKWKNSYLVQAAEEINDGLGVKDTILNISAVLFRSVDFNEAWRKTLADMRIAGDWYFIVNAIKDGKVYYDSRKLNYHRRHAESVIGKTILEKKMTDFFREFRVVQEFVLQNYALDGDFCRKWESYLRKQWKDFYPGRPFEELNEYYPFEKMKEMIELNSRDLAGKACS